MWPAGQKLVRLSTLPWPEIPLLSTSKQHGVQGGKFTDPSYIQSTNPGTVELEGKASYLLTGNCLVTCSTCVCVSEVQKCLGERHPAGSLWPGCLSATIVGISESQEPPGAGQSPSLRKGRCWTHVLV